MLEEHKETAKLSAAGVTSVLIIGVAASYLVPETETGKLIKFFTPSFVGILFGAKIYLNELSSLREKLGGEELT